MIDKSGNPSKTKISHFKIYCYNCKQDVIYPIYKFFRTGVIHCPKCEYKLSERIEMEEIEIG